MKSGISQKRRRLATRRTAACQGSYQKLHVCALALVWAAFLGACENFSFQRNRAEVSNVMQLGFHFSALPQSQREMAHWKLITEEGSGTDGDAQRACPGTAFWLTVDDL